MTPERRARVEQVCSEALECEPSARGAYLVEACAGDEDLRREIESLLAREARANGFLDSSPHVVDMATVDGVLKPGLRLGPYLVLEQIGAGGMGEVYRAKDTNLERDVAIKVLPDAFAQDPERLARFEREAKTLASLNHPNIAIIHGLERADGVLAIVMELVEGPTLADRIAQGPIPLDETLPIAKQIAEALEAAHEQGVIHRDLKPANIKLRPDGTVRVLDFGLAKTLEPAGVLSSSQSMSARVSTPAMTQMGMILGTAAYMSPEQAKGKPADKRSDVWAFGCVLYEMLTRSRAFGGKEVTEVLRADVDWTKLPDLHPRLVEVLKRCLRKDPGRRPRDIGDLRIELDEVSDDPEGRSLAATADGGKAATSRRTLAMASLVGFLTALTVTVAFWTTRPRPEAEPPALSFHVTPPAHTEFQFSPSAGGSAISPDGRTVAFVAVTNGTPRLWIRALDSLTAHELPDTDGAKQPFWSPDSGSIGFFTSNDLRRIDISGQKAVILARALDARGGTWNADGTIVFNPVGRGPLYQVSASGGTPARLTTMSAAEYSHRWPKFLPDGRTFLYSAEGTGPGVYITTLDRPGDKKLLFNSASEVTYVPGRRNGPGYMLWVARETVKAQPFDPQSAQLMGSVVTVPGTEGVASSLGTLRTSLSVSSNGTLLYSSGGSRYQLAWFGHDGTPRGTVGDIQQYIGLRLSPDDRDVLVTIRDTAAAGDLWRIDLATGARSRITSNGGGWYGVWSPDSQQVAFTALNRREVLQTATARGGGEVKNLSTFDVQVYPSDWSSNGRYLAYTTNSQGTSNDVSLLSMIGAPKSTPLLQSQFTERHAQFSPDAGWVAFTSNENGREDVYAQSFPDATTRRIVSNAGGAYPRWGRGGKELFYRAPDGHLMTIPVRLVGSSIDLGTPAVVMRLVEAAGVHPYPYDVAADGRILALTPASGAVQDLTLTVLMNWQAALKP